MEAIYENERWEVGMIDFVENKVMLVKSIKEAREDGEYDDMEIADIGKVKFLIPKEYQMALFNQTGRK